MKLATARPSDRESPTGNMNVILVALGSHGDVHPFVGIGMELRRRGHRVKIIAYSHFERLIADAGLELISCGSAEEFKRIASDPRAWKRFRGMQTILGFVAALIEEQYYHFLTTVPVPSCRLDHLFSDLDLIAILRKKQLHS